MKKIIITIIALSLITVSFFGCGSKKSEALKTDRAGIYTEFITSNAEKWNSDTFNPVNYIGINDLDLDGIPELIISDDAASAASSFGIFEIKEDKVELAFGWSRLLEKEISEAEGIFAYSNFGNNWLTLRKNSKTGELKYFMYTGNGNIESSFGNVLSFSRDEKGGFKVINEFFFEIFNKDESDSENVFKVSGKEVSEEEYNNALSEFENQWQDTGVKNKAMCGKHFEYENSMPVSFEKEDIEKLFSEYKKEY